MNLFRVLLADDHPMTRDGLKRALSELGHFEIVGETGRVADILESCRRYTPDLVVLDIQLADARNGLDLVRPIQEISHSTRIAVFTNYGAEPYVAKACGLRVNGYLTKDLPSVAVANALLSICHGCNSYSEAASRWMTDWIRTPGVTELDSEALTPGEKDVIRLLPSGLSNEQIAMELQISDSAVRARLTTVYGKLGASNRTQAVVSAVQRGLFVIEPEN